MSVEQGGSLSLYSVGRSAAILTGGAVATQILGVVRELFLATQIGATAELDAFLIAFALPIALPGVLTSGVTVALVPAYLEARENDGLADARRLAGTILTLVAIAGAGIWLALEAFAGFAIALTGPGLSVTGQAEAIGFLELLAPVAFLNAVSAILLAVCQAEQRFVAISAAAIAGSITTVVTMLVTWDSLGLDGLAIGSLLGPIVMLVVLLGATARAAVVPLPGLRSRGRLGPFLRHAAPLTVGAAVLQLNVVADRAIASLLGPGAVSVLRYADVLVRVPVGAIGPAWGSAIYPALVRSTLRGAADNLAFDTERAMRYAIALFVPVALLTAAVAPLAVAVAYGRGAFSTEDLELTAGAVAAFAPLLLILMVSPVLTGALNARRRGQVLLIGATLNVALNLVLDVALGFSLGVVGVALSSSVTSAIVLAFFAWRLTISEPAFRLRPIGRTLALAVVAGAPIAIAAAWLCWIRPAPSGIAAAVAALLGIGILGMAGYFLVALTLGMEESRTFARLAADRLQRGRSLGGRW
jgi:putative peptidoglycan lipid II flippase